MAKLKRFSFPIALGLFLLFVSFYLFNCAKWLPFDFDEIEHAHASWMISAGLKPYADFHEMHTPFFWLLYSPFLRNLPPVFESLIVLRQINIAFSILALLFLALLIRKSVAGAQKDWAVIGALLLMVVQPNVVQVLTDFRADHLSLALALLALLLVPDGDRRNYFRAWFFPAFIMTSGLLLDSKLVFLAVGGFGLHFFFNFQENRNSFKPFVLGVGCGIIAAIGGAVLLCALNGIDIKKLIQLTFVFHYRLNQSLSMNQGLAQELVSQVTKQYAAPLVIFLLGLGAISSEVFKHRAKTERLSLIVVGFILVQVSLVKFPFKQYVYSIYLLWAAPMALFLSRGFQGRWRWASVGLLLLLLIPSVGFEWGRWQQIKNKQYTKDQIQTGNRILQLVPPDAHVFAQPPFHPIFRKDSLYSWIEHVAPQGSSTEDLMMGFPDFRDLFTAEGYEKQLTERPPMLVVIASGSERGYAKAIRKFVTLPAHSYQSYPMGGYTVYLSQASDR